MGLSLNGSGIERKDILVLKNKIEIVKEVLVGKVPVSEVCRKYSIDTRQYYYWQKKFARYEIMKLLRIALLSIRDRSS